MSLKKSTGNMYEFVSHVWSPIKGCKYSCSYCYARRYGYGDNVEFNEKDLKIKLGEGKTIFVGHLCDMWGPWVTDEQIQIVLEKCAGFPSNTFYFQTKNPARYFKFLDLLETLDLFYLGTTVETDCYGNVKISSAPSIPSRVDAIRRLSAKGLKTFVTIEPIMKFNLKVLLDYIRLMNPDFVTIGADSKGHGLNEPTSAEVQQLIENLGFMEVEIREKKNLKRLRRGIERQLVCNADQDGLV